ncbi:MAG: hypothetical protein ACR2PL_22445, partial [Dehalococcoidia bacterium]
MRYHDLGERQRRCEILPDELNNALSTLAGALLGAMEVDNVASAPDNRPASSPSTSAHFVYRGLAQDEIPVRGQTARDVNAGNDIASHMAGAREPQWISTT